MTKFVNSIEKLPRDNRLILGKPKLTPKQSWSYKQWVQESDYEWTEYAKGTIEDWKKAFNNINM